jgi:hypothetical protein
VARLRPCMSMVPAAVAELADGAVHRPSIVLVFGLCSRCSKAEKEPFEPPPDDVRTPGVVSAWTLASAAGGP